MKKDAFPLTQFQSRDILKPYYPAIHRILKKAFALQAQIGTSFRNLPERCRSDLIRCAVWNAFEEEFATDKKVRVYHRPEIDLLLFIIKNKIALRLKKLDRYCRPKFNRTKLSFKYIKQLNIFNELEDYDLLVLGYQINKFWTEISEIFVLRPDLAWADSVTSYNMDVGNAPPSDTVITPIAQPIQRRGPVIRLKNPQRGAKNAGNDEEPG